MQKDYLTYKWHDVALLSDQRAYTIICKTMLQIPQQEIIEIQDAALNDWVWQRQPVSDNTKTDVLVPFRGSVTIQIYYLNQDYQQETCFAVLPLEGAWEEPLTEQNSMRLLFYHTQTAGEHLLLETVLQVNRNQPLDPTQVLIGQFQMEEQIVLEDPWPSCSELLLTSMVLQIHQWQIDAGQLQLNGEHQIVCVYQSSRQTGEQVFVHEYRVPMKANILVPKGVQELSGIMPYYQSITAQVLDDHCILVTGSGVFCTLPNEENASWQSDCREEPPMQSVEKDDIPSVINSRGSRRANLSKYMRHLNNSVETPTSIRNIEIVKETE